jgi:hypothetical protein
MLPMSRRPKVQIPFKSELTSSSHTWRSFSPGPMNGVADRLEHFLWIVYILALKALLLAVLSTFFDGGLSRQDGRQSSTSTEVLASWHTPGGQ